MVVAGDPRDMLDMVGDGGDGDDRLRMGRVPRLEPGIDRGLAGGWSDFSRASSAARSLAQRHTSGDRKPGTKVTITTPPLAGSSRSTSSGTLRGCGLSAAASEWEKITGARLAAMRVAHRSPARRG